MMKKLITTQLALALSLAMVLFAGNTKSTNKAANMDANTTEEPVMNETVPPDEMPTLPFNAVVIRHTVADYNVWKPFFDADSTNRNAAGLHLLGLSRGIENENEVEIPFMIDDVQKAKAFTTNPVLKDVMKKGGVTSAPSILFIKVLRMSKAIQMPGDYVEVTLKIKDFISWIKVFDGEGAAMRAKDGLQDGVLAQGIDDPHLVYLVFKITNLEQAKAAMINPARKKLMQKSGVMGEPEIYFGRDQQ
jgi:hypothetical protein